jgi:acetyl-CoA C-acetyltransferase
VVLEAKRLATGAFMGQWATVTATHLGAKVVKAVSGHHAVGSVYMGCVLQAGVGQAPARQAALLAGLPPSVTATTVNKVCGSGMKAIALAAQSINLGNAGLMVAGGMESMTNAPYLLTKARMGYRAGHGSVYDHMLNDGLEDAYGHVAMGVLADQTAQACGLSREAQEAYALQTYECAQTAQANGYFDAEIIPTTIQVGKEVKTITQDEPLTKVNPAKFSALRPAFTHGGTITAATASSLADGAAALLLSSEATAIHMDLKPLARIVGYAEFAREPEGFTLAPLGAVQNLLMQTGWSPHDVDLFEIKEAFAIVPLAMMKEMSLPRERMNIHGGACALGHPLGASGARIVVTLIHALRTHSLKRGIAAVCIGGGEGMAMAVEVCP